MKGFAEASSADWGNSVDRQKGFRRATMEELGDSPSSNEGTAWDSLSAVPFGEFKASDRGEIVPNYRQQNKILKAFENARGGVADTSVLFGKVALDFGERDAVIKQIASRHMGGPLQEEQILRDMRGPINYMDMSGRRDDDKERYERELRKESMSVFASLNDGGAADERRRHELRILSAFSDADFDESDIENKDKNPFSLYDFNHWEAVNSDNVIWFINRYPTPKSFERDSERLLSLIGINDHGVMRPSEQKQAEYRRAMADFKMKVYGKKYEYWEQMKLLREEVEKERSSELISGKIGLCQSSRSQARRGEVTLDNIEGGLEADGYCEDMAFVDADLEVYGVFDGAGGMGNGRSAAEAARNTVRRIFENIKERGYREFSADALGQALDRANKVVSAMPDHGYSTGTLAHVIRRGDRSILAYATVGDSRIYVVDDSGTARQITRDEGEGSIIYNSIGNNEDNCCLQKGVVALRSGDRVVVCSDGITGDYGDDLMSNGELGRYVHSSKNAKEASKLLVANARKRDDRTAIVFSVD